MTDYTRRGDFQVNANGNLVNSAGYYLMGVPVDPKTGNPLGNMPQVLKFQNNFVPAQATTTLNTPPIFRPSRKRCKPDRNCRHASRRRRLEPVRFHDQF